MASMRQHLLSVIPEGTTRDQDQAICSAALNAIADRVARQLAATLAKRAAARQVELK